MKLNIGDVRALADRIRRSIHEDLADRVGIGDALADCDPDVRAKIDKDHTDVIAKEIEAYFA